MWQYIKDYFSFSRKDLRGIYVLLFILSLLLTTRIVMPLLFSSPEPDFTEFDRMVLALEKAQRMALETEREASEAKQPAFIKPDREIASLKINPFPFDPNAMNEESWLRLGLNMRQVRNIQNFVGSGGRFRKKEDLKRIYSISDEEYNILAPYITITVEAAPDKPERSETYKTPSETAYGRTELRVVDINSADSLDLIQVRGIGPVFARRIIQYRERLGGFHTAEQLLEVFGLDSARFGMIEKSFSFDRDALRLIDVNNAELKDLTNHPYIDFYLAKSIIDNRIKKGGFASDADLYGIPLMHDALYKKIAPYFQFSQQSDD